MLVIKQTKFDRLCNRISLLKRVVEHKSTANPSQLNETDSTSTLDATLL
jgi:hypothetical protein